MKRYIDEKNKLIIAINKKEQFLNNGNKHNESLSNDLYNIRNQIKLVKNEIDGLEVKEDDLKSQKHHLLNLAKRKDIETNQKDLEKKKEKLQKLNKKQEKCSKLLKTLEKKKLTLENAPKQKELETVDLVAFEAPIPICRKGSFIDNSISDDDDDNNITNNSICDDDIDDDITSGFSLNRLVLRKKLDKIHEGAISLIKFAHDKSYLASGGNDGTIIINKYSHDQIKQLAKFPHPNNETISIDFSPNDENFMTACSDLVIRVYKTKEWTIVSENNNIKKQLNHVEFYNSNEQYISCGKDKKIKIFDINKAKPISKLKSTSHPYYVSSSLGNHQLLSGHSDSSVILWDSRTGKQTNSFKFNKGKVIQVLASPIYNTVISLSINKVICLTDLRNLNLIKKIDVSCTELKSSKTRMAIKDKSIILGGHNGFVYSWSLKSHQLLSEKEISKTPISAVDIKQEYNKMAVGDVNGDIFIY